MEPKLKENFVKFSPKLFHWAIIILGGVVFLYSTFKLPFSEFGWDFLVISALMLILSFKVAIDFSSYKSNLSVSDIFIFLMAILYGPETATCLAAVEAYVTSSRFTKKAEIRIFNSGILSTSIFISYNISYSIFGSIQNLSENGFSPILYGAMVVMVISHFLINTFIVAISNSLRSNKPVFENWTKHYLWMLIPFFASGSVALVTANAIQTSGYFALLLILPIIGIIYFSYHTQQGKLQAITEQADQTKHHLVEMKESEDRFRSAFSNAPIGIGILSKENNWLQVNESLCKIFGFTKEEIVTKSLHEIVHPADIVLFLTNMGLVLQGKKRSFQAELRYFDRNIKEIWTQTSISRLNDTENSRLICQIQDITARRQAEQKLRYDACYDSLTGLSNRAVFMDKLKRSIARGEADKDFKFAVMFVDLDNFKLINDSLSHTVGDKLLVAVAKRLNKCLPEKCTLARFGSDEFLILFDDDIKLEKLTFSVEEIQRQINLVYGIDGQEINITASIGIVFNDSSHNSEEDILRDADTALHIAKTQGRSRYVFFDEQMRAKALNRMQLEKDLQRAVEKQEIYLVYQPIVSIENEKIIGFEALVRWHHPEMGLVSPLEFISLAEENGTILKIGKHVLEEACRQLRYWQNQFSSDLNLSMSINVSPKQLLQKHLLSEFLEVFDKHKILPSQIKLEITESVVVENSEYVISILKQFRAIGVRLSMDDFGTGYSSLSYLHKLPINTLKIDRSFVSQMTLEAEGEEIVKTIILLAKALKLDIVAEGIETLEQHKMLGELGCDYGQGYYFSKPLEIEDATDYLKESFPTFYKLPLDGVSEMPKINF